MSTSVEGHENRLMEAVAAERRGIEEVLDRLESETEVADPGERRRLVDQLIERVAAHAAARRDVLYPRVSRDVPDGDSLVDLATIGLDQIKRTRKELSELSGTEPTFKPLVAKLAHEVWEHLEEEQTDVLPQLVDAIGIDAANELGDELTRASAAAGST
jgi:Hemerythrin HHE cation binding domain